MVSVVLDSPGLERVHERHKHDGTNDVIHQLRLRERVVSAIVTDNEQARHSSAEVRVHDGKQIPGRYGQRRVPERY